MNYNQIFEYSKELSISGRYITNSHIEPLLNSFKDIFEVKVIGESVLKRPIQAITIGKGAFKVLMWSQMHGNESTTTKALFDFFNFLSSDAQEAKKIKESLTLCIIPILNPDGAQAYTRVNANEVDLNRDAVDLSQPESKVLRTVFYEFKPDFCFNLHDQRSVFGVADTQKPATVSFLAPAYDVDRNYNPCRLKAIEVINAMNEVLQSEIPGQVGRFDDTFNGNCVGDSFQLLNVPTVLIEAGHFYKDYEREETRKYIFYSYLSGLLRLSENVIVEGNLDAYLKIPQNKSNFYDFVYKKFKINKDSLNIITNFAAHYDEILIRDKVIFEAKIIEVGETVERFGHFEFDAEYGVYSDKFEGIPQIDQKADFMLNNQLEFKNGLPDN